MYKERKMYYVLVSYSYTNFNNNIPEFQIFHIFQISLKMKAWNIFTAQDLKFQKNGCKISESELSKAYVSK